MPSGWLAFHGRTATQRRGYNQQPKR